MRVLLLKLFRDIKTSLGGFISIIFVIGIGSVFFSGLSNSVSSVRNLIENYYENQKFMDYTAYFSQLYSDDIEAYRSNEKIKEIKLRYTMNVISNVNNKDTNLRIHTLTENINVPYIYEGKLPSKDEIILDKIYMKLNKLEIGDYISFDYNGIEFNLKISGIMDSPEYVSKIKDDFSANVDLDGFGAGYVMEDTIKLKFDENNISYFYTEALIKSNEDLNGDEFEGIQTFVKMIKREDHVSYSSFDGALNQIDKVVVIFPIIFFIVAGIITFISMSKTVENQRSQIGIMGALGFSSYRIYFSYIMYSVIASVFGSLIGGLIGIYSLPGIILKTFSSQYTFPVSRLNIYSEYILYGILISIFFSITATIISCHKTLKEAPSDALRPRPPKNSKHIFLEKLKFWKKISFIYKIIIRNIFYNKMRIILSSVGMIGSISFLITGFSLKSSVNELLDYESRIRDYDFEIKMVNSVNEDEIKGYSNYIDVVDLNFTTIGNVHLEDEDIEIPVVIVKGSNSALKLEDKKSNIIGFNDSSVVIPSKLLDDYNINISDSINIDINFGMSSSNLNLSVSDIAQMYSSQMIYVSSEVLKRDNIDISFNGAFIKLRGEDNITNIVNELKKNDNISSITLSGDLRDFAEDILSMINSVIMIIIVGSAVLAISVIYNITSINIFERIREIATLLVLGYYDREINRLIFIENIVLSVFGSIIGIPFGIWLFKYMQILISDRGATLPQNISGYSILLSFIMVMLFSIFTNLLLKRKVLKVNMIEALKGVE